MMTGKMAAMMTGVILVMSATTIPAFAKVSHTSTQPLSGGQQQTQVSPKTGDRVHQQKWSLDEKDTKVGRLTPSEQATFNKFKAGIEQGLSPGQAARKAGSKFSWLDSTNNQVRKSNQTQTRFRLSLSQKASVTFQGDVQTKVLKVMQIGSDVKPVQTSSHTQPLLQH
jgi:hypothetical protein